MLFDLDTFTLDIVRDPLLVVKDDSIFANRSLEELTGGYITRGTRIVEM